MSEPNGAALGVPPLPPAGPMDLLAGLGLPSPEETAREAAEAAEWRQAVLTALDAQTAALADLVTELRQLHLELGDLAERIPAMPRIFRRETPVVPPLGG